MAAYLHLIELRLLTSSLRSKLHWPIGTQRLSESLARQQHHVLKTQSLPWSDRDRHTTAYKPYIRFGAQLLAFPSFRRCSVRWHQNSRPQPIRSHRTKRSSNALKRSTTPQTSPG